MEADGSADASLVTKSSGHPVLDDAALEAAGRWRFDPARTGDGRSVRDLFLILIDFYLD